VIRGTIYFTVLTWLIAGCAPRPSEVSLVALDVESMLNDQAVALASNHVPLSKTASVGGVASDTTWVPAEVQWRAELKSFEDLGLVNKRLYQDMYRVEGPLGDKRSNLHIQRYSSKQAPLTSLDIFYMDDVNRFRRIEGIYHRVNNLYATHRTLVLEFDEVQGKPLLTHYQITGYQKLALRDTVHFSIQGVINW